jgi:hypothetical protein
MRVYPNTRLWRQAVTQGTLKAGQPLLDPVFYRAPGIDAQRIQAKIQDLASRRVNWVVGSGGAETVATLTRMYRKGYTGPLWEYLIR